MPKISVIMGVYNCKDYVGLENSINSIINQTFQDWEFIICNDGSSDYTLNYLHNITYKDNRIKIVSYEQNHGLAYALNYCLKYANGEYIARQDDDDISMPSRLEKEIMFLENYTEYAFVGSVAEVYDNLGVWGKYNLEEKPNKFSFLWNSPFLHPTILIRKSELKLVGGYRVSKETRRCEDYDLFMRMYSMNMKGYNLQEILYSYQFCRGVNKKYRSLLDRIYEAVVRYRGYKMMGILFSSIPYVFKPILIGIMPMKIFDRIKFMKSNFRKV